MNWTKWHPEIPVSGKERKQAGIVIGIAGLILVFGGLLQHLM
ncbi:hypothetical protein [Paenibacillus swuensis]|nr:hypothetical protein [Paenibacillus swuensis]